MTFRFVVRRVTGVAGAWVADGVLEHGTVRHGARATARTDIGDVAVTIATVAMVDPPRSDPRDVSLTLAVRDGDAKRLEGAVLEEEP